MVPGRKAIPAAIICQDVFTDTESLLFELYLEYNEPAAQPIGASSSKIMPISCVLCYVLFRVCSICSANSRITPTKPIIKPNTVDVLFRFSCHFGLSRITNHMAADETRI